MRWASPGLERDQLVLFPQRLDECVPPGHAVRLFDEVLAQLDFSPFEGAYKDVPCGRPPFHPRVLAGVILYGLLVQIRSSRKLEAALWERIDFRWLARDERIDHTTLSEFRRRHPEALKALFVKVGQVAAEAMLTPLSGLMFDGTRAKASNHRQRSLTPRKLNELERELAEKFAAFQQQAESEEALAAGDAALPDELQDLRRRQEQIRGALAELRRLEAAGEEPPKRIPLTDPESRITPNKEGGFAANYTPTAGVDADSGLILTGDVLPGTDEEQHLLAAIDDVEANFGCRIEDVMADGLFATGANLAACDERGITLYSPPGAPDPATNPAVREDLTQPVPADRHDALPTHKLKGGGRQLDKAAFVYDAASDAYVCPQAKRLQRRNTTTDRRKDGTEIKRTRYAADPADCAACPLKSLCLQGKAANRQISRDQFEPHREKLAQRMAGQEGQAKYARRKPTGERPFAVIKQYFGVRQFLLRGLERVRMEWTWVLTAFNLKKLLHTLAARAGPEPPPKPSAA